MKSFTVYQEIMLPSITSHVGVEEKLHRVEPVITEDNGRQGSLQKVETTSSLGTSPLPVQGPHNASMQNFIFAVGQCLPFSISHLPVFTAIH